MWGMERLRRLLGRETCAHPAPYERCVTDLGCRVERVGEHFYIDEQRYVRFVCPACGETPCPPKKAVVNTWSVPVDEVDTAGVPLPDECLDWRDREVGDECGK